MVAEPSEGRTFARPWVCSVCKKAKWWLPEEAFPGDRRKWAGLLRRQYKSWGEFCGAACRERWQALERLLASNPRRPPEAVRRFILERDRFTCRYCGKQVYMESAHIDHLKPWSKGGRTTLKNLATACRNCNLLKHTFKLPKTVHHNLQHGGRNRSPRLRAELERQWAAQPGRRGMTRAERNLMREVGQLDADLTAQLEREV